MKAIILLFDGKYAVNGEEEIVRAAGSSIYENTSITDTKDIKVITLDDVDFAGTLIKPALETVTNSQSKKTRKTDPEFEAFCRHIISTYGRPSEMGFGRKLAIDLLNMPHSSNVYALMNLLASDTKLTEIRQNLLKEYRLEEIREVLKELDKIAVIFH